MYFDERLQQGTLLKRYKRFLADVRNHEGHRLTMHCPNTGSMKSCSEPGSKVYFSTSNVTSRKYPHTLELVESEKEHLVCVNTILANKVVAEALAVQRISELKNHGEWVSEIAIPDESGRFDFGIAGVVYVEVKSVTYLNQGTGLFPDARSARAIKHVRALERRARAGERAVLFFCILHTGVDKVSIAKTIDPDYDRAVDEAVRGGVEVLAYKCKVSSKQVTIDHRLPFLLDR